MRRLDALVLTHAQLDHEGMALADHPRVPPAARARRRRRLADADPARRCAPNGVAPAGARGPGARAGRHPPAAALAAARRRPAGAPRATRTTAPSSRSRASGASTCCSPPTPSPTSPARSQLPPVEVAQGRPPRQRGPRPAGAARPHAPAFAGIEVGRGNTYGHPTPPTLAELRAAVPHVVPHRPRRHRPPPRRPAARGERVERRRPRLGRRARLQARLPDPRRRPRPHRRAPRQAARAGGGRERRRRASRCSRATRAPPTTSRPR